MAKAATNLKEKMRVSCLMEGINLQTDGYCSEYTGVQGALSEKMAAAQWSLFSEANRAEKFILTKRIQLLTSPHGFLAGIQDVERISVLRQVG